MNNKYQDIAIIGLAGRYPTAGNVRAFYKALREGVDCVRPIPEEIFCNRTLEMIRYVFPVAGLLDDIDKFDYKFFGISSREAKYMDPHQRVMLELAYEAIESAGYNPADFARSKTGVIVPNARYEYHHMFENIEAVMVSGNEPFSIAGRISRQFDLYGPAYLVDTGCSSTLMAANAAREQIQLGNADQVLVVGAKLILEMPDADVPLVGVESIDGKTRSFNADSNGSGTSEAAAAMLFKPLEKAVADGDIIYAVLKGSATNSNARRSGSLTATCAAAQAECIKLAWENAGVDPLSIGYIEAHGSGTKLGDPIEIEGIDGAYRDITDRKKFVAVSCVKSNIGHTDQMSGFSGLSKVILSLKNKQLFPSLHFNDPNPLIDFENSATYINTESKEWVPESGVRRAGISSFGFAGNNVHAILEEAPEPEPAPTCPQSSFLVTFSSKRREGVAENMRALADYLEEERPAIEDVSHVLAKGREHHPYRAAAVVRDLDELRRYISEKLSNGHLKPESKDAAKKVILLFSDQVPVSAELVEGYRREYPVFAEAFAQCRHANPDSDESESFRSFAFRYSFLRLLRAHGITSDQYLGLGSGDAIVRVLLDEIELREAIEEAKGHFPREAADLADRLTALVDRETEDEKVLFIEVGPEGGLSTGLRKLPYDDKELYYQVISLNPESTAGLPEMFQELYLANYPINWHAYADQHVGRKTYLPGYCFEKIRCWVKPAYTHEEYTAYQERLRDPNAKMGVIGIAPGAPQPVEIEVDENWSEIEGQIATIWASVLGLEKLGLDDDFFALGGHSLFGTMVANQIEKQLGVKLEIQQIFIFNTVRTLASGVQDMLASGAQTGFKAIEKAPEQAYYPLAHSQLRLWVLEQQAGGTNLAYNLPAFARHPNKPDYEAFERRYRTILDRHDVFRTSFHEVDGRPVQKIHPTGSIPLPIERYKANESNYVQVLQDFARPFDLTQAPLIRVGICELEEGGFIQMLDCHHIISDGTTSIILTDEFNALARGEELPSLDRQYKDYAVWEQQFCESDAAKEQEQYWLAQCTGAPQLNLPTDFPRPAQRSFEGGVIHFSFEKEWLEPAMAAAQKRGATFYMFMFAAYSTLLSKYCDQEDLVVGMPVAGRPHADLERMVGMFVNILPIRSQPTMDNSFSDYLGQVKEQCLKGLKYQTYPMESLINKLDNPNDPSRNPLYETTFQMQNLAQGYWADDSEQGIELIEVLPQASKFDMTLIVTNLNEKMEGIVEYSSALFKEASMLRLLDDLKSLVSQVVANPQIRLKDISLEVDVAAAESNQKEDEFDFDYL